MEENHSLPEILHDDIPVLPVLPLKNMAILPKSIIPVIVGRKSSVAAVEAALKDARMIFVTAQRDTSIETPVFSDLFSVGTRSTILQIQRMPKGGLKILVEGVSRARCMGATTTSEGYFRGLCRDYPTIENEHDVELEALWRNLRVLYLQYVQLNSKAPADLMNEIAHPSEIERVIDTMVVHLSFSLDIRQEFLELASLKKRVLKACGLLRREIEIFETDERIKHQVQIQIEKNQREYYLSEQRKVIDKELGREDHQVEITQLRAHAKTLKLPAEAAERIEKELKRLEQMPPASAEGAVIRHYIDWIISLPWHKQSKDTVSLTAAEKILNRKHSGLIKPKERIIEYLAAKKFSPNLRKSPIICLVGPPGVGKTSLAQSIAESLGREFRRISFGGVRDEAEIRGHRRTYIGALPGKLIQAMRQVKTVNPVILLDEIDKLAHDAHGDPAAALLEVLDPEQNATFVDHFLEVPYDLSQVVFITTANHIEGIPYPLHDRMEVINLSGYTEAEKLTIAREFLVPRNLKEHSLSAQRCKIPETVLRLLITEYTKEAGVRQLERLITKVIRKVIQVILKEPLRKSCTVTPEQVREWLGYARYKIKPVEHAKDRTGVAFGLAWTEVGGDILEIETGIVDKGKGTVTLTGQLGEVMQESAHAALTYIRSRASQFGLKPSFSTTKDIHIHIPEGATPKDGPSAGITMCSALVSELTKTPVNPFVAMTGEVTLRGRVLPVGGLKEKILAAKQHGIKTILLPRDNKEEVDEIINEIGSDIALKFVDTMDEVLEQALLQSPFVKQAVKLNKKRTKISTEKQMSSRG